MVRQIIKLHSAIAVVGLFILLSTFMSGCYYDKEENLYGGITTCDTSNVTFSSNVLPIIQDNCYACHSQAAGQGGIILEGYANIVIRATNGSLVGAISHAGGYSPMPKNGQKLAECDIKRIQTWINAGALDN